MMRRLLEYQADQIEAVLASHKAPVRVTGGRVLPQLVQFDLSPAQGVSVRQVQRHSEEVALALGVSNARVTRQGGSLFLQVPHPSPKPVHLLDLQRRLTRVPFHAAILGMDETGAPLLLRLPSPEVAHVLIAGTTGSGKTVLVRSMVLSLAMNNRSHQLQMVLMDPKGHSFNPLNQLPHLLQPVVTNATEALVLLANLVRVMERRDGIRDPRPRVVVVIDELADLALVGGKTMERFLTRLVQRGREAGIHIVACTQKPTAAVIGSLVKAYFPARLVGAVVSPEDAKVAAGVSGTGAERLNGRGDFLLVVRGDVIRLQAAYISETEMAKVVNSLSFGTPQRRSGNHGRSPREKVIRLAETLRAGVVRQMELWQHQASA
ncbi:MAG: DNA translocase FtsK [Anaerolineae bacterium]|nr:MAG: DNA translocase FtsK [Anaerolineae bacterium]